MTNWPEDLSDRGPPTADTVLCWRIDVAELSADARHRLFDLLDEQEHARALRFVRLSDRHSFAAAHGGLRLLLGRMLAKDPQEFRFKEGPFGKPYVVGAGGLQFNMSHSGGIILIVFAKGISIGADVEQIRSLSDRAQIIHRFFHPGEIADLAGLSEAEAELAFFRCWARKEAVVKALGFGMSLGLDRYRVSCKPGAAPALLALDGEAEPTANWSVIDLEFGLPERPTHVGAIAARAKKLSVACRAFKIEWLSEGSA